MGLILWTEEARIGYFPHYGETPYPSLDERRVRPSASVAPRCEESYVSAHHQVLVLCAHCHAFYPCAHGCKRCHDCVNLRELLLAERPEGVTVVHSVRHCGTQVSVGRFGRAAASAWAALSLSTATRRSWGGSTSGHPPDALRPPDGLVAGLVYWPSHPGTKLARRNCTAATYSGRAAAHVPMKSSALGRDMYT